MSARKEDGGHWELLWEQDCRRPGVCLVWTWGLLRSSSKSEAWAGFRRDGCRWALHLALPSEVLAPGAASPFQGPVIPREPDFSKGHRKGKGNRGEKGRHHSRQIARQAQTAEHGCLRSWSARLLLAWRMRADSRDESKPHLAFFVAVWPVLAGPVMSAESRIVFLHPSPINLAANGKSPWTWVYDDLFSFQF